jgi:hypothetical protein
MSYKKGRTNIDLVLTITTDLGETFLFPDEPLQLVAHLFTSSPHQKPVPDLETSLTWSPGMRVLKTSIPVSRTDLKFLCVGPIDHELSAGHLSRLSRPTTGRHRGLMLPAWADICPANGVSSDVSFRRLQVTDDVFLELEEEIGESIARHIWDAGMAATAFLTYLQPPSEVDIGTNNSNMTVSLREILSYDRPINILELGCGVGILGLGLGAILSSRRDFSTYRGVALLMTDLEEAENRARCNIQRLENLRAPSANPVKVLYENLDWDLGREGKFGSEVLSRSWDLIVLSDCTYNIDMLPALVETLSQIHTLSKARYKPGDLHTTSVFLATKRRHSSEDALFGLMSGHGWSIRCHNVMPMPVLYEDSEAVDLYIFGKA